MEAPNTLADLLKRLDAQRDAYLQAFQQVHELLVHDIASLATSQALPVPVPVPVSPRSPVLRSGAELEHLRKGSNVQSTNPSTFRSSSLSKDDDDEDENEDSFYVQLTLEPASFDHEDLRKHLSSYDFSDWSRKILRSVVDDEARLKQPWLFPDRSGPVQDRSHLSYFQVFDVGVDGAPLQIDVGDIQKRTSKATAIWHAIKDLNKDLSRQRLAVGRITIAQEPSPILFGALHLTMHQSFDVDELYYHLVQSESSSAHMHRAFDDDHRKRRSFVFSFEYFTIVGDDCVPMTWQLSDKQLNASAHHIPITRCSSVVALSLSGKPIRKIRNPGRRVENSHGYVYDPWASWQVLNIQCYPDWKATTDTHDSTKHYVNGPEAFLYTLLAEYRDAQKRFEDIYKRITKLITPPLEFLFDSDLRDALLFEDKNFTYSRRYFWSYQTLGIINDSIKALVDSYEDNFTDEVWDGRSRTLWPMVEEGSARNEFWKRRMAVLRSKFEREVQNLKTLIKEYDERRHEIRSLREQLFSGTSVLESRKSVEMTQITVQQGHNIKILTLVSIFFLPLTFVTSVFGMTNMPTTHQFWMFGIVIATVCIPFFVLIGSLNTSSGMQFWRERTKAVFFSIGSFFSWLSGNAKSGNAPSDSQDKGDIGEPMKRSASANEGMAKRLGLFSAATETPNPTQEKDDNDSQAKKAQGGNGEADNSRRFSSNLMAKVTGRSFKETHVHEV